MANLGIDPVGGDPSILAKQVSGDDELFGRLVKNSASSPE